MENGNSVEVQEDNQRLIQKIYGSDDEGDSLVEIIPARKENSYEPKEEHFDHIEDVEESLSLQGKGV